MRPTGEKGCHQVGLRAGGPVLGVGDKHVDKEVRGVRLQQRVRGQEVRLHREGKVSLRLDVKCEAEWNNFDCANSLQI